MLYDCNKIFKLQLLAMHYKEINYARYTLLDNVCIFTY